MLKFSITPKAKLAAKPIVKPMRKNILAENLPKPLKAKTVAEKATARRTTVQLAAYGNRLFEPTITKTRPIIVEFVPYWSPDGVRWSKDGFFGIKYLTIEKRCYLIYFLTPLDVNEQLTLDAACLQSANFETFEYENDADYMDVPPGEECTYATIQQQRGKSALGKVEKQLIVILKDRLVAEKFLKRQKLVEKQDLAWEEYKINKIKADADREAELAKADADYLEAIAKEERGETNVNELELAGNTDVESIVQEPKTSIKVEEVKTPASVPKQEISSNAKIAVGTAQTATKPRSLLDLLRKKG